MNNIWKEKFDEAFYKNHLTRQWISKWGENYGSEHLQMGRAELLKFIAELLAGQKKEIVEKILEMRGNAISACNTDANKERIAELRGYAQVLVEVIKEIEEL